MDVSDSTCYSNLLISCILPNQSLNLQIKSRPSLKGKTHFFNEKNKSVPVFEGQKMVTLLYTHGFIASQDLLKTLFLLKF